MSEHKEIEQILIKALEEHGYEIPFWKYADDSYTGFEVISKKDKVDNKYNNKYFIQIHI